MKKLSIVLVIIILISCITACSGNKQNTSSVDLGAYVPPVEYHVNENIVSAGKSGIFYYTEYHDYIEITDCSLEFGAPSIEFPSVINGKPVKAISVSSLQNNAYLTSAVIPNTVTEICNYLFSNCTKLVDITLSNALIKVGCAAFFGTPWLEQQTDEFVVIGDGVLIDYNGDDGDIVVPKTVKYLSDAFSENTHVFSVAIPTSVIGISDYAFYNCSSLTDVIIPSHISDIGTNAFQGTTWLMANNSDFVVIGNQVLISYLGSETEITVPEDIKYISGAFSSNSTLTKVTIPASVRCVRAGSFYDCTALTSVTFLGADTKIEDTVFAQCSKLTDVVLPANLEIIDNYLFYSCANLKKITLPSNTSYIGTSAFYNCSELVEINIPDSVKTVNSAAFFGCIKIEKLVFPDTVTSIGEIALACCYSLKEFTVPSAITDIPTGLFSFCTSIKELRFEEHVKNIGEGAFEGCNNIQVYIEGKDTSLGKDIFMSCEKGSRKVYCPKGSVAESYLKKNKIKYSILKD